MEPECTEFTSHLILTKATQIHFLLSTSRSSNFSLTLMLPHQNRKLTSPLPHTCCMTVSSHFSWFDHPNNIWWGVQIIKFLVCSLLYYPFTSSHLGPNILLSPPFSNTLNLWSSSTLKGQVAHPHKTTDKIIILYTFIFLSLNTKLGDKGCYAEWLEAFLKIRGILWLE